MSITNVVTFPYDPDGKYLFNRAYALTIGAPKQTAALQYASFEVAGANSQIQPPSPLRVRFDISKGNFGTPNKCKIEIFNLAQKSRQAIKAGYLLQLQAGYAGLMDILFVGNVQPNGIKSARNGADIITSVECFDGGSAILLPTLDKSYPPGSTLIQVIQDIAAAMKVTTASNPVGAKAGYTAGVPPNVFGRGFTAHGSCKDLLNKLLAPQGLKWSIQNGSLTIVPKTSYNGNSAVLVSANTGMIGVPSNNGQYVEFMSLLNPKLVPEALIQLESQNRGLNGYYKILGAHYEGDTHDSKWQATCQCTLMAKTKPIPDSALLNPNPGVINT